MALAPAPEAALDKVGWTYIGIVLAWTTVIYGAMGFLWYHRRLPELQMRRLPLVFVAMTMLHCYWVLCLIGYVIGPIAPCAVEYWIMSILVPFGIAMFQISNSQFMHIASRQKRYTSNNGLNDLVRAPKTSALDGRTGSFWRKTTARLRSMDRLTQMVILIAIGMAFQAAVTLFIYLASEKFHPGWGIFPPDLGSTDAETRMKCSRGWEWWLSITWQFFWAWIYAPYILWKSRGIEDTHGWRLQTILCCVAGLPCSPLWLAALYIPQFGVVNKVWIPPAWFSISIFFIECFTIFIPCYQIFRTRTLRTETLAAIAEWEAKNKTFGSVTTPSSSCVNVPSPSVVSFKSAEGSEKEINVKDISSRASISSRKSHMYTMLALEHALKWNADPLQKFAALKDFSGENISFLTHLATWKKEWSKSSLEQKRHTFKLPSESETASPEATEQQLREHFNSGLRLYAAFVSIEHAEFPINISSRTLRALDNIFRRPADLLFGDNSSFTSERSDNSATPFLDAKPKPKVTNTDVDLEALSDPSSTSKVYFWGEIPPSFAEGIFDDAEAEIKYLVLTNTWAKFVNAGYSESTLEESGKKNRASLTFWKK